MNLIQTIKKYSGVIAIGAIIIGSGYISQEEVIAEKDNAKLVECNKGTKLYTGPIYCMTVYYNEDKDSIPEKITTVVLGPYHPANKAFLDREVTPERIATYKSLLKSLK